MSDTPVDDNDELAEQPPKTQKRRELSRTWRYLITDRTNEDGPRGKEEAIPHFLTRHAGHESEPEHVQDPITAEGEAAMRRANN